MSKNVIDRVLDTISAAVDEIKEPDGLDAIDLILDKLKNQVGLVTDDAYISTVREKIREKRPSQSTGLTAPPAESV